MCVNQSVIITLPCCFIKCLEPDGINQMVFVPTFSCRYGQTLKVRLSSCHHYCKRHISSSSLCSFPNVEGRNDIAMQIRKNLQSKHDDLALLIKTNLRAAEQNFQSLIALAEMGISVFRTAVFF